MAVVEDHPLLAELVERGLGRGRDLAEARMEKIPLQEKIVAERAVVGPGEEVIEARELDRVAAELVGRHGGRFKRERLIAVGGPELFDRAVGIAEILPPPRRHHGAMVEEGIVEHRLVGAFEPEKVGVAGDAVGPRPALGIFDRGRGIPGAVVPEEVGGQRGVGQRLPGIGHDALLGMQTPPALRLPR